MIPVCARIRLRPDSLPNVLAWAEYIDKHRDEALATLRAEGVALESVFLDSTADGDFLVYYMLCESLEKATQAAAKSASELDAYHHDFKREHWLEVRKLELLLDLQRDKT